MTTDRCAQPAPSGHPCHHLAGRCPFHPAPEPESTAPSEEPPEPHRYVWDSLNSAIAGRLSPASLKSLVSAFALAERLGPPPVDRDQMHEEIALRGAVMHGLPPRNDRQWELARDLFTPGALHMMALWLKPWDLPAPAWLADIPNPDGDPIPPLSRDTFLAYSIDHQFELEREAALEAEESRDAASQPPLRPDL